MMGPRCRGLIGRMVPCGPSLAQEEPPAALPQTHPSMIVSIWPVSGSPAMAPLSGEQTADDVSRRASAGVMDTDREARPRSPERPTVPEAHPGGSGDARPGQR